MQATYLCKIYLNTFKKLIFPRYRFRDRTMRDAHALIDYLFLFHAYRVYLFRAYTVY